MYAHGNKGSALLFNSLQFFIFLPTVLALYWALPFKPRRIMLLLAGYVFYGMWDPRFLFLILFSTVVDFSIGALMGHGKIATRERVKASLSLVAGAIAFLTFNWAAAFPVLFPSQLSADESLVNTGPIGLCGPLLAVGIVTIATLAYPAVVRMSDTRRRRVLLFVSVAANLGFLAIFKYFNFFEDSFAALVERLGFHPDPIHLRVILPVGISFYTFQSLSYTIDVARREMEPTPRLFDFALFVAYFPPMVAGPIERARHLLPQLSSPGTFSLDDALRGMYLILLGLVKKVAIADGVAGSVNAVFNSAGHVTPADVAGATLLFAIQIYCDFSGYSDIAIGVSHLFGINLSRNFNLPYFAQNPSEFWTRWHISLSSWLRDYLYIPLGGSRGGELKTYRNLMLTMLLGGLWHGAAWNYVFWGGYQGLLLCAHRLVVGRKRRPSHVEKRTPSPFDPLFAFVRMAVFFVFCCYGWLLFRANSLHQVISFTHLLFGLAHPGALAVLGKPTFAALVGTPLLLALHLVEYSRGDSNFVFSFPRPLRAAVYAGLIVTLILGTSNATTQFIYFQF
jgi:alginate O-acetyltransferase complex protein AlgI